ncbi:MAG TPA: tetratricopeptide repeat protein, partial [Rhodanobacteraceae bacterium]|nr:tetratricopeptide repeat protein [Rhodanobacteraceae bacterium]
MKPAQKAAKRRLDHNLRAFAAATLVAASALATSARADETQYPRAIAAASALHFSQAIADTLKTPVVIAIVHAVGGSAADGWTVVMAGNLFSAVGALGAADGEWQRVAEIATRRNDVDLLTTALAQRVEIALSQGDYARCETLAQQLAGVAGPSGNRIQAAFAEANLGVVERRRGHLDGALQHQERALDLYRSASDPYGTAQSLTNLATVYRDRGDFAKALDMALEAVVLRERTGDKLEIAYRNVALLYREIEDATTARAYFERALDVAAKRGAPAAYSPVVGAYAGLLNDLGEFSAAQKASEEALAIDTALGDVPHQGLEHLELGRALLGQHQNDAAGAELEIALKIGREIGQRETVARSLLDLAAIALAEHDRLRAHGLLDEAIAGLEAARLRPQLALAYASREQLARAEHDDTDALRFAHKYASEREELLAEQCRLQLVVLREQRDA